MRVARPSLPWSRSLLVVVALACACRGDDKVAIADDPGDRGGEGQADDVAGEPTDDPPAAIDAGAPLPCPPDLGDHWVCSGADRVRCVDGVLQSEACASGCEPPTATAEAVCGCGGETSYTRWNCLEDGDLHACRVGGWLTEACDDGCATAPIGTSDGCNLTGPLQTVVTQLGEQCASLSPGTTCGIAVRDLTTGETASYRGAIPFEAASSFKAVWVALALYDVGVAAVEPFAHPIFVSSDNGASGKVIDLLSSPDRINTFIWHDVHMPDTGFCRWNFEKTRESPLCESHWFGGYNYLAADDSVRFLTGLWDRSLIGAERSDQLLAWMQLSPRSGYGGWLGTQLPEEARATMHHKAGWLPPSASNEIGIIQVPGGHAYAVALLFARDYNSYPAYDRQLKVLEYTSCVLYHAVAGDAPTGCQAP